MGRRKRERRSTEGESQATGAPNTGQRRLLGTILLAVALAVAVGTVGGALLFRSLSSGDDAATGPRTAIIVDQLSLTQPNMGFVVEAIGLLKDAGYEVEYTFGEEVTVDFYRNLPVLGYDIIIFRVHSGIINIVDGSNKTRTEFVGLFTGEPYSEDKYPEERAGHLAKANYYAGGGPPMFGITPAFVEDSMRGDFDGAIIVMMGCDGLRSQLTAEAFLDKGASAFVSWGLPVSAAHTDAATQRLLEKLLVEGLTTEDAVRRTAAEVGPDPQYGAELRVLADGG